MDTYVTLVTFLAFIFVSLSSASDASDFTHQSRDDTSHNENSHSLNNCFYPTEGIPGPPGPPGDFGKPGEPGPKGHDGLQGRDGIPGMNLTVPALNGDRGERGQSGPIGQPGSAGNIGPEGPQGNPGPEGSTGPPGEKVVRSPDGYRPGETGFPGAQGPPGMKGEKGIRGNEGECQCSPKESGDREDLDASETLNFSAFSVARHSSLLSTNGDETIWWDHVFTNVGDDFAPETGIFTCEIPGYYYFAFHIHKTSDSANPLVQLMLNGVHVGSALEYGDVDDEDSTTNNVVLHLESGDEVWLQLYDATGFHGSHNGFTTFLGYLASAD